MAAVFERMLGERVSSLRKTALAACATGDAARSGVTPGLLDEAQAALRQQLLWVEAELRTWRAQADGRQRAIKRYRSRYGSSPLIGRHLALASAIEESLENERQVLRQIGDMLAWLVLRGDPKIIAPLYAERTHHLNVGAGLVGPMLVIEQAHATGEFLVLDNDLTRCLGVGDLTVVRANGSWRLPLTLECLSDDPREPLREGLSLTVNMSSAVWSDQDHTALHREFAERLATNAGTSRAQRSDRKQAQDAEMMERARVLARAAMTRVPRLLPARWLWQSLETVVERALTAGAAYDIPEPGIAYAAVRRLPGDDAEVALRRLESRKREDGMPYGSPGITSADFARHDELSAIASPIALWPVSQAARSAVLSGVVFFTCTVAASLWEQAFERVGLSLAPVDQRWDVRGPNGVVRFSPREVLTLQVGVAFDGLSPRAVADAVRAAIDGESQPTSPAG